MSFISQKESSMKDKSLKYEPPTDHPDILARRLPKKRKNSWNNQPRGKAVLVPRTKLDYMMTRNELNNVGVYFLFGENAEKAKPVVYIGEAEDCLDRLKQQTVQKSSGIMRW